MNTEKIKIYAEVERREEIVNVRTDRELTAKIIENRESER
jgi:hypothetical protein